MSNCKDKIEYTCSKRVNSRCVDYEGEVSECSELDSECRIHTVHEVLEDSSRQLTKICSELDLSEVDKGCLEIEGDRPKVKDFIQSIVNKVCDPQAGCDEIFNTTLECSGLDYKCFVDECSEEFSPQNLKQLFQMLIDRSCEGGETPEGCNCELDKRVFYKESRTDLLAGNIEEIELGGMGFKSVDFSYTITPQDGAGEYEVLFHSGYYSVVYETGTFTRYGIFVNDSLLDPSMIQSVEIHKLDGEAAPMRHSNLSTSWFQSGISLSVGDTIGMYITDRSISIQHCNMLIKKIAQ